MKIDFIKRGAETRLILIFAGWSTSPDFYRDCTAHGWDTAVVYDFRDLTFPKIPEQYKTIYIFAYSIGIWAASIAPFNAAAKIAICGTPFPSSDEWGIPSAIYEATIRNLSEKSLQKFHIRMAGGKSSWLMMKHKLPENPDIGKLREELEFIKSQKNPIHNPQRWDRAYVPSDDAVIPSSNQQNFWQLKADCTDIIMKEGCHALDLAGIVRECIPNPPAIGKSFLKAAASYNSNAIVQAEVCDKMIDLLRRNHPGCNDKSISLLEIGPGRGMLTHRWKELLKPQSATYIDLSEMPRFEAAFSELYIKDDAESFIESSSSRFDVILSASTIQWFADPLGFVSNLRSHLNPGGVALISTFVKGNLHELDDVRTSPIIYRSAEDYEGCKIDSSFSWRHTLTFKNVREMLLHVHQTGISPSPGSKTESAVKISRLPKTLTYCPMVMMIKN